MNGRSAAPLALPGLFAAAFGALMVAAAARPAAGGGWVGLGAAAAALVAGLFYRPASVVAVLLTIAGMAVGDSTGLLAAVSGLSAAAYLVTRYTQDAATVTLPTVLGMVGFTAVAAAAGAVSVQMAWVPLVAPAITAAILILVALPLVPSRQSGAFSAPGPDLEQPG